MCKKDIDNSVMAEAGQESDTTSEPIIQSLELTITDEERKWQ